MQRSRGTPGFVIFQTPYKGVLPRIDCYGGILGTIRNSSGLIAMVESWHRNRV